MKRLIRSFVHAARGILFTLKTERNFQLEATASFGVFFFMMLLPLTSVERAILVFAVALVLALELTNTAVERVIDILKPRVHPYARVVKDVMAGAVAVVSCAALLIGIIILLPYCLGWQ